MVVDSDIVVVTMMTHMRMTTNLFSILRESLNSPCSSISPPRHGALNDDCNGQAHRVFNQSSPCSAMFLLGRFLVASYLPQPMEGRMIVLNSSCFLNNQVTMPSLSAAWKHSFSKYNKCMFGMKASLPSLFPQSKTKMHWIPEERKPV